MDLAPYDIYRNAISLVFAPSDANALVVSDALDSALLAQLQARKQAEPFKDPERWDQTRLATLAKLQWIATSSKAAAVAQGSPFTLAELLGREVPEITTTQLSEAMAPLLLPETWLEGLWAQVNTGSVQVRANVIKVRRNGELAWMSLSFAASGSLGWCGPYGATEDKPVMVRIVQSTHALSDGTDGYAQVREKVITALGTLRHSQNHRIATTAIHKA